RSGVYPAAERACTFAPWSISNFTISECFSAAAHMSAIWPRVRSFALTSAPCAISSETTSGLPVRAAIISGVSPVGNEAFGFAPAFNSFISWLQTQGPDVQASASMDQILARELGNETRLASLELALEANDLVG